MSNDVLMGAPIKSWKEGKTFEMTFVVTEDCNLICKYCYCVGKNRNKKLSLEVGKGMVDYLIEISSNKKVSDKQYSISNNFYIEDEAIIFDFIGGEPFLEIELIDKLCDYIKLQLFTKNHHWFDNYIFGFSSNGLLYHTEKVQNFIKKNRGHVSIGISIDGNKEKHDLQRIKPNGTGSYDDVIKNLPLWQKQFPGHFTKATFSSDDLPLIKDSIISLWNLGIKNVSANIVYEDVWKDGDEMIYEEQLKALADHVIKNDLYIDHSVRFFDQHTGYKMHEKDFIKGCCGAGKHMLAMDTEGNIFPCFRFLDFNLNNKKGLKIGDYLKGININKLRPFYALDLKSISSKECLDCDVSTGCSWCVGHNYDVAKTNTIYNRAVFNCKMHQAQSRANSYFWQEYEKKNNIISNRSQIIEKICLYNNKKVQYKKYIYFITSSNITSHCCYDVNNDKMVKMKEDIYQKGIEFSKKNGYIPVFLDNNNNYNDECIKMFNEYNASNEKDVLIFKNNSNIVNDISINSDVVLVGFDKENISSIFNTLSVLIKKTKRINVIKRNIDLWVEDDVINYDNQLTMLIDLISNECLKGRNVEINILTDRMFQNKMNNCGAGFDNITLGPDGLLYICPGFYFHGHDINIGNLDDGIINSDILNLLNIEKAGICRNCDAFHCNRCFLLNYEMTGELNTPSKIQCLLSHIERNASKKLQQILISNNLEYNYSFIKKITYIDPLDKMNKI